MSDFALPVTCYAQSGDLNIAYQTMGNGPLDIILIPGFISHVEFTHEMIGYTGFLRRLSAFARVVTFDKRGQGLSDRADGVAPLEQRMDDVRAIMDEIGSQRAILFGFSEGCPMSILFAATYPERVSHIILFGGFARFADYAGDIEERIRQRVKHWGTGEGIKALMPSLAANPDAVALFAKFERLSASPGAIRAVMQMNALIDVRSILPSVRVPTLVLHRQNDALVRSNKGVSWRSESPTPRLSNILAPITPSGMGTWKRCLATSRNS
jgi:pimeloyl-ACP methyl ester carboxylesterase